MIAGEIRTPLISTSRHSRHLDCAKKRTELTGPHLCDNKTSGEDLYLASWRAVGQVISEAVIITAGAALDWPDSPLSCCPHW